MLPPSSSSPQTFRRRMASPVGGSTSFTAGVLHRRFDGPAFHQAMKVCLEHGVWFLIRVGEERVKEYGSMSSASRAGVTAAQLGALFEELGLKANSKAPKFASVLGLPAFFGDLNAGKERLRFLAIGLEPGWRPAAHFINDELACSAALAAVERVPHAVTLRSHICKRRPVFAHSISNSQLLG